MSLQVIELTEYPGRGHLWPRNLDDIVDDFILAIRPEANNELERWANELSIKSAATRAGLAVRPDGKRYDHQFRLPQASLDEASRLLASLDFSASETFHDLHELINAVIRPLHKVGELMVYDTALRIGARLGLEPHFVYLHRGTREGAYNLGLPWRKPYLTVRELPRALRRLRPREIEDCLCIYKGDLKKLGPR
jgi:hypothetical protein